MSDLKDWQAPAPLSQQIGCKIGGAILQAVTEYEEAIASRLYEIIERSRDGHGGGDSIEMATWMLEDFLNSLGLPFTSEGPRVQKEE